jgi:hypothetical protein
LIDEFYFEHHVCLQELAGYWKSSMSGSLLESLKIFSGLQEKGIAAPLMGLASLYQANTPLNKILADQNSSSDPRSTDRRPGLTDC